MTDSDEIVFEPRPYEICLSFAGEDRDYVSTVAEILRANAIRVFYDEYERSSLWGRDLYEHLDYVYSQSAEYCVMFISRHYATKLWTTHERKSAQSRAFSDHSDYILPVRFDDTEIPGIRPTIGYVDASTVSPEELATIVLNKVAPIRLAEFHRRSNYIPQNPDILYKRFGFRSKRDKEFADMALRAFHWSLSTMTEGERFILARFLIGSCPHDLPNNVHVSLDILSRETKWPRDEIMATLRGIKSLGFKVRHIKRSDMLYLNWRAELIAFAYVITDLISAHYCAHHATRVLMNLNFSALSTSTAVAHTH